MTSIPLLPARLRVVLSLLLLAAACSRERGASTVVEFWAMGREGEMVQQLVPEFERRLPGVRVRVQQVPWSAAHEKLLTAYVGKAMPDVIQVGNTWLPELVALGALARLDAWMAASSVVRPEAYFAGILETNVIDGGTYGVPWYVDTRVIFYRTDVLRAAGQTTPPTTWDGWLEAMRRIRERGAPDRYAILLPLAEWEMPVILALERGAGLLRDQDRYGNFQSPPFREAFRFYLDLFARDLAPRAGVAQIVNLYQDFASGFFALFVSGPWSIGELERRLPAAMAERWSTAPMPGLDPARPGVSLAGGASLAVLESSPRRDLAWRWLEYLSEPAQQAAFYRSTGDLPARVGVWEEPSLRESPSARAFARQLRYLRSPPKIPEWERIASKIGEHAEAAIRARATVDEALGALDRDVDAILAKRRWLMARAHREAAGGPSE